MKKFEDCIHDEDLMVEQLRLRQLMLMGFKRGEKTTLKNIRCIKKDMINFQNALISLDKLKESSDMPKEFSDILEDNFWDIGL